MVLRHVRNQATIVLPVVKSGLRPVLLPHFTLLSFLLPPKNCTVPRESQSPSIGVHVDYNVVHLRTSLVQLFVLLLQNFEKVVQMIELKRFGGAPDGYPFAPLPLNLPLPSALTHC
jgi:hypothetical protein